MAGYGEGGLLGSGGGTDLAGLWNAIWPGLPSIGYNRPSDNAPESGPDFSLRPPPVVPPVAPVLPATMPQPQLPMIAQPEPYGVVPPLGASLTNEGSGGGSPAGLPVQAGGETNGGATNGGVSSTARTPGGATTNQNADRAERALAGLRAIVSPGKPDVVKPTTPHIYRPEAIKAGQLFSLMQELGSIRPGPLPNQRVSLGQVLAGRG